LSSSLSGSAVSNPPLQPHTKNQKAAFGLLFLFQIAWLFETRQFLFEYAGATKGYSP
jgi:hypothetical protein